MLKRVRGAIRPIEETDYYVRLIDLSQCQQASPSHRAVRLADSLLQTSKED